MADQITLTHSLDAGTLATGDTRPHAAILKANGWKWGRSIAAWYVPHSRDQRPKAGKIDATAAALEAAGVVVERDIRDDAPDVAEREANRAARLDDRRAALTAKAERKAGESDAAFARVHGIADMIPMGQPILVGHHSEVRHRRDLDRIDRGMRSGIAADKEATESARRAESSARYEAHRMTGPATMRRIEKLEAEQRSDERTTTALARTLATGATIYGEQIDDTRRADLARHRPTVDARIADRAAELDYWRAHLDALKLDGWRQWGPADFAKGDTVVTTWGPRTVARVNAKSLTVERLYPWSALASLPYDEVRGKVDPEPTPEPDPATEPPTTTGQPLDAEPDEDDATVRRAITDGRVDVHRPEPPLNWVQPFYRYGGEVYRINAASNLHALAEQIRADERADADAHPNPPAVVVTRSGLQTLLPGHEAPSVARGNAMQRTLF